MTAQTVAPLTVDEAVAALLAQYGVAPATPVTVKLPTDVLATPSATIPVTVKTAPKTAPVAPKTKTAPIKGSVSFTSPDGFVVETEKIDEALFKALALRATTNDWYPVLEWLNTQPSCMLRIRRSENSAAKSPTTKIWAAITRALKLRLASAGKFDCRAHATEKGVWFLIKRV